MSTDARSGVEIFIAPNLHRPACTFVAMRVLYHIGRYTQLLGAILRRPARGKVFWKLLVAELEAIGLQSLGIVALLSVFMGAVICLQTAHQISGLGRPEMAAEQLSQPQPFSPATEPS